MFTFFWAKTAISEGGFKHGFFVSRRKRYTLLLQEVINHLLPKSKEILLSPREEEGRPSPENEWGLFLYRASQNWQDLFLGHLIPFPPRANNTQVLAEGSDKEVFLLASMVRNLIVLLSSHGEGRDKYEDGYTALSHTVSTFTLHFTYDLCRNEVDGYFDQETIPGQQLFSKKCTEKFSWECTNESQKHDQQGYWNKDYFKNNLNWIIVLKMHT